MPTPWRNAALYDEWLRLEALLVARLPGPRRIQQARRIISDRERVSYEVVRNWLRVGRPYWVLYHLDRYLKEEFRRRRNIHHC